MNIFGLTIARTKALNLQSVDSRGGWWRLFGTVGESYTGAWQRNVEVTLDNVMTHPTVFACTTLIAGDSGKVPINLVEETKEGTWEDAENPAYSPVLRTPNRYQTIAKFIEQWVFSKLIWGNAYVLKERDQRGVVVALYVLDPNRVKVLVADDGSVFYDLLRDPLSNLPSDHILVPAREIIHDPMYGFYHPLGGISPLHASGLLATLGINIAQQSANFFANSSMPGGILTAPAGITTQQAEELKSTWETNFSGNKAGKLAVLGGELKYDPVFIPADKSQLTEQWNKVSEAIASAFHVPFYLVGGPLPPYGNVQSGMVLYFTQCLQALWRQLELSLDEGLGLGRNFGNRYGTEFDKDDLLWMDSLTRADTAQKAVASGMSYNESRLRYFDLGPVKGGESPLAQQQNYSLAALARRDASDNPFGTTAPAPADVPDAPDDDEKRFDVGEFQKELSAVMAA